jgi:hypothetical protein
MDMELDAAALKKAASTGIIQGTELMPLEQRKGQSAPRDGARECGLQRPQNHHRDGGRTCDRGRTVRRQQLRPQPTPYPRPTPCHFLPPRPHSPFPRSPSQWVRLRAPGETPPAECHSMPAVPLSPFESPFTPRPADGLRGMTVVKDADQAYLPPEGWDDASC